MKKLIAILFISLLFSCCRYEKTNNKVVENFKADKYLGTWYEIARLDHSFERGCSNVSANYSKKENGEIKVVNKCIKNGKEKSAQARAHFKNNDPNSGHLRVSFFWPFYGNYKIIYLDEKYQTAIIDGGSTKYFWILSRQKSIPKDVLENLLVKARKAGFDTSKLIYTKHDK